MMMYMCGPCSGAEAEESLMGSPIQQSGQKHAAFACESRAVFADSQRLAYDNHSDDGFETVGVVDFKFDARNYERVIRTRPTCCACR